jgi:hypothetical protein
VILEASRHQFVRSDLVIDELARAGATLVAPVFNFLPLAGTKPAPSRSRQAFSATGFDIAKPAFKTGPTPGMCYWLSVADTPQGLMAHARYHQAPLNGFSSRLQQVLHALGEDPDLRISSLFREAQWRT